MEKEKRHVIPLDGKWAVKSQGSERVSKVFETKEEATEYANDLSKKHRGCTITHTDNGRFENVKCDFDEKSFNWEDSLKMGSSLSPGRPM
jgi:hypothetical protein